MFDKHKNYVSLLFPNIEFQNNYNYITLIFHIIKIKYINPYIPKKYKN